MLVSRADQMSISWNWIPVGSLWNAPGSWGGCCRDRGQNSGGGGRCPAPVLASNNQGAPLGAGTAPQPLHFIPLSKLPSLSFFHFHFSLLSMNNLLRQDACAASLCLARGSHFSSCSTIYIGGRNQFQHLSFEHQTCGLAQDCGFAAS